MRKSKPDNSHRSRFSDGSLVIPGVDLGFKSAGGPGGRWCCALEDANFSVEGLVGTQLNGRTFGIVGLGKIGRVVAGIANGFGCKVIANDRTQTARAARRTTGREACGISARAVTPETRHLIDAQRLAKMQRDAILVNTSRGPLVDTPALIEVFKREQQGQIGADAQRSMPKQRVRFEIQCEHRPSLLLSLALSTHNPWYLRTSPI